MRRIYLATLACALLFLTGCTNTKQLAATEFRPPEGDYKVIVMRPDVSVSLLTAGGTLEPREDWTDQARQNLLGALKAQQMQRGGRAVVAVTPEDAGADVATVLQLDRLHDAVGRSIRLHKYTPGFDLPTKKGAFDWTLGQLAVDYGRASGFDYALFLHAEDSFSSGGRIALQAVSMLGCVVGVCYMPPGGQQIAFVSLVDLRTGRVVWYNFLHSAAGDIRTPDGAAGMVDNLLDKMKPAKPAA